MKIVLLSLLLISFLNIFSQDSCVVKVFPGDCQNCYIGMKSVEAGDESIKKTIVFPDLSKAEANAYLRSVLNISDINKFNIIVSDSVYNSMNRNLTSEVYVYSENKLYNHSLLKKFHGFDEIGPYEIKIPDSIAISVAAAIINHEDYFFITDSKFGNCIFISKHGENKITTLTAQDFTTEENFNKISGDTLCYHMFSKYREVLKSANMDRVKFKPSFEKRNKMTTFLMTPDIKVENNEAGLFYKTGIVIFNNPNEHTILRIDEESLPENYVIFPAYFSKHKGEYYIQLTHVDRNNDDQYLLGKFLLENDKLTFSEFPAFKIPSEYLPSSNFKSLRKMLGSTDPFLFLQYSLSYYNMDTDKTSLLPFESVNLDFELPGQAINLLKFEYSFKFIDAYVTEKILQVLHEESGKYYVAYINRKDNSLIKKLEISNPAKTLKAGMFFYSTEELFYLSKDNTIVVEKINYR